MNAPAQDRLRAILTALDGVLEETSAIADAERKVVAAWREQGRPDIVTLFDLMDGCA